MDKTSVKVWFSIKGDDFDPQVITEKLGVQPTTCWKKNSDIKPKIIHTRPKGLKRVKDKELKVMFSKFVPSAQPQTRLRWFSLWQISTPSENSLDSNKQILQIDNLLKDKVEVLLELKEVYDLEFVIEIIPYIENNEKPALFFDHYIIGFAHKIQAVIDIDQYIYS